MNLIAYTVVGSAYDVEAELVACSSASAGATLELPMMRGFVLASFTRPGAGDDGPVTRDAWVALDKIVAFEMAE